MLSPLSANRGESISALRIDETKWGTKQVMPPQKRNSIAHLNRTRTFLLPHVKHVKHLDLMTTAEESFQNDAIGIRKNKETLPKMNEFLGFLQ